MKAKGPLPPAIRNGRDLAREIAALVRLSPEFAPVLDVAGEVPLRKVEPGYAGLVWVIAGQQISVAASRAILARLETALGVLTPETVAAATDETLRTAGLSIQKQRTLRASAEAVADGLDLSALSHLPPAEAMVRLTAISGIGRWTAEVFLLFALGHPDIFPAGDLALQEAARLAFGLDERPKEKELLSRAEAWRPHRAAAARLLWAYYRAARSGRDATPV